MAYRIFYARLANWQCQTHCTQRTKNKTLAKQNGKIRLRWKKVTKHFSMNEKRRHCKKEVCESTKKGKSI